MRAHGERLGSRSPRATFSLSPSSRPCPAPRATHNIPHMAPSASQDLQPIAPAMSVALPPSTQHPSLPSSSTPSENSTPIPSGSTPHSSKKPTAKRKRTGGGDPASDSADGSSTPRTRDGPKKKKANRACFHCQKAHLTCDDCEHQFIFCALATVCAALQAARTTSYPRGRSISLAYLNSDCVKLRFMSLAHRFNPCDPITVYAALQAASVQLCFLPTITTPLGAWSS